MKIKYKFDPIELIKIIKKKIVRFCNNELWGYRMITVHTVFKTGMANNTFINVFLLFSGLFGSEAFTMSGAFLWKIH